MIIVGNDIERELSREAELAWTRRAASRCSALALVLVVLAAVALRNTLSATNLVLSVVVALTAIGGNWLLWERHVRRQRRAHQRSMSHLATAPSLGEDDLQLMRVASEHSASLFGIVNLDGTVRSASISVERLLGHRIDVVRGTDFREVIVPYDRERLRVILARLGSGETVTLDTWVLHCDGSEVPFDFTVSNLMADPAVRGYLVSGQIARSLAMAREHAQFLATHDPATGLFTRSAAHAQALATVENADPGSCVAVVQIDLDHLAQVNEVLGDLVGDEVVVLAAQRIVDTVGSHDVVARWDGDEFLVVSVGDEAVLGSLRDRVAAALEPLYVIEGSEVAVEAKVAMVIGALDRPFDDLLARVTSELADIRMHRMDESALPQPAVAERRLVIDQLQRAVECGELSSWFQPFVDQAGRIVGFEALLRWTHPTRGITAPDTFLPLLSLAGLEGRVDDMVVQQAIDFAKRLATSGHGDIQVHINTRPRQLSSPGFAQRLIDRCTEAGLSPSRLGVEVTESDLLHVGPVALANLTSLRRARMHVAIDDFGTGFSSLSHLLELPVDSLKVDQRFISRLETDPTSAGLTAAVIGLADNLGLVCVAEGVETQAQRDLLAGMGGTLIQGHLYSPALVAEAALELAAAAPWETRPSASTSVHDVVTATGGDPT
jgi:diguanylate cyclase (GGDEF)-like protein/PAS domain S-box-containing protein